MADVFREEAYCPLGQYNSPLLKDETILSVAARNNCTAAQVLLSWGVQRGTSVVPKSSNTDRIIENIAVGFRTNILYIMLANASAVIAREALD